MLQQQKLESLPPQKKTKSIGNYQLGKTLGQGTFGKVKFASHTLTGQPVAIKVLQKRKIVDVADVQRVSRQIHILKLIRHPNIIQLYEIIQTQKQLFLVMQYISQGQLFDYIVQKKCLPQPQACNIFQQILDGVQYIHSLKVVHRDLKPQNLLIDYDRRIKIVDFGLSNTYKRYRTTEDIQLLKTACGSPCYAAPQMIAGKKYAGLGVDIWSCGVILFAMVCGCLPFQDPNTPSLYKKILAGQYSVPKFVSAEAKDILKGILTTDPDKRLTIEQIRKHRWISHSKPLPAIGLHVGYHIIPLDRQILKLLQNHSIEVEFARKCIESNRHNHTTTTYYLLLKKLLKSGGKSSADLGCQNFDRSKIQPQKKVPSGRLTGFIKGFYQDYSGSQKRISLGPNRGSNRLTKKSQDNLPLHTTGRFFPKRQDSINKHPHNQFIIRNPPRNPYLDRKSLNRTQKGADTDRRISLQSRKNAIDRELDKQQSALAEVLYRPEHKMRYRFKSKY